MADNDTKRVLVDRWELVRRLHTERGMTLWEAYDRETGELVHLKELQQHLRGEPMVEMRFRREATIADRLDHPALVGAERLVEEVPALVYEVPGDRTIADRLGDEGPMEATDLALLFEPVVEGLEYAHRRGIVHRNLSLRDVWIDEDDGTARITGFGGARILDMIGLTTHSTAFGVSYYRAPEQLSPGTEDFAEIDRRTDVWAVGVMLFEMLTGRPPVEAGGPAGTVAAWQEFDVADRLGDDVDTPVGRAIRAALTVDPSRRASSMAALRRRMLGDSVGGTESVQRGPECWQCGHPRIEGFNYCFRCGAEPLVQPSGTGDVELFVPKFQEDEPVRHRGVTSVEHVFVRRFEPGLDARRRGLIYRRLRRAGAVVDRKGQRRMRTNPFRIAADLTMAEAFQLGEFLRSGEAPAFEQGSLHNYERISRDTVPVLYRYPEAQTRELNITPFWATAGLGWSSLLLNLAGAGALLCIILYAGIQLLTEGRLSFGVAFLLGWSLFGLGVLGIRSLVYRKAVARFPGPDRSFGAYEQWHRTISRLSRESDRRLAHRILHRARETTGRVGDDWMDSLYGWVRPELEVLTEAPRREEWEQLQLSWERLRARQRRGELDDPERLQQLADRIEDHERRASNCELARTRLSYMLEALEGGTPGQPEDREPDEFEAAAEAELELSVLEDDEATVEQQLDGLRAMHEAYEEVDSPVDFRIPEVRPDEDVRLDVELPARFEPVKNLGDGGMASVVLVQDSVRGERVALKVAHREMEDEALVSTLFEREFEAGRKVDHPGVVSMYEHIEVEGRDALVMEHVEGVTLGTMIRWRGALPPGEVRRLARSLAEALDAAHRRGIVHGDVKPENVMVDADDEVTIIDFGLARMEAMAASPQLEEKLGTPGYAAPELKEGGLVDERADVYGVGVTLMEAVTGELPFGADARSTVEDQRLEAIEEPGLRSVIEAATARQPTDRIPSVEALRWELDYGSGADREEDEAGEEACHDCGADRVEGLERCLECGARRRVVRTVGSLGGRSVILDSVRDRDRDESFLTADETSRIREVVDEFPNLWPVDRMSGRLSQFPVLFAGWRLHPEDAEAICESLDRHGIEARASSAVSTFVDLVNASVPRILTNTVMLLIILPVMALFVGMGVHDLLGDSPHYLFAYLTISIGLSPLVLVAGLVMSRLFGSATTLEEVDEAGTSQSSPDWEDRACELYERAGTRRSRQLVRRIVETAGGLRSRWVDDDLRGGPLVDVLEETVEALLELLEEFVDLEVRVERNSPGELAEQLGRLDRRDQEEDGEVDDEIRRLRQRLEEAEDDRRRLVELGARLLRAGERLEGLVGDEGSEGEDDEIVARVETVLDFEEGRFDELGEVEESDEVEEAEVVESG